MSFDALQIHVFRVTHPRIALKIAMMLIANVPSPYGVGVDALARIPAK